MAQLNIAVQLYTVRDLLAKDFIGTLKKVRRVGYAYVELAGYGPYKAGDLKKILDDTGLVPASTHCPVDLLENDVGRALDEAAVLGVKYVVCPYLPEERRRDEQGWRRCAALLNWAGQAARDRGFQLCYHNHSFEFVRLGGRYALDLLFDETDPSLVQAELDTYWVKHGHEEPVDYINRLKGRCPILHLKDMADDDRRSFAAVGEGVLDFGSILAAGQAAGAAWGIVEQDICPGNPIDSIARSLENLRRMGIA